MRESLFIRLLSYNDKEAALTKSISNLSKGQANKDIYSTRVNSFGQISGTPFSYWVSEYIRQLFTSMSKLESEGRNAQSGASTMNDFRFLRGWWETEPKFASRDRTMTLRGGRWVPFAKGGVYSPFYIDWELVIDWERDGEAIKNFAITLPGTTHWSRYVRSENYYFQTGLTWPRRTTSGITVRVLPKGCIFADKGPAIFVNIKETWRLLALMNSLAFEELVALQLGAADAAARSYEVGVIGRTPTPNLNGFEGEHLENLARKYVELKRKLDCVNEISHIFHLPALLQLKTNLLAEGVVNWQTQIVRTEQRLKEFQLKIDDIACRLYGITSEDKQALEELMKNGKQMVRTGEEDEDGASETDSVASSLVIDLLSYITGCTFGRWDIRLAIGERAAPELPDPFAPLLICSPGMLTGDDGFPLYKTPHAYPLDIIWEGILVDDPDHQNDIVYRVREVLRIIWQEDADAIEQEACQILGIKELREYFRRPNNDGFWMDHVKRYSKSRRKAPIYWLLQSSKRSYSLWLYYHRLDNDMLFKALTQYVEPKIRLEESRLEQIRRQLASFGTAGREVKQLEKQLDRQDGLITELYDFRDKLRRVADLHLEPDLNDGVILNIAPLWELVPWGEAKRYWEELLAGKYEWSAISKQLRAKGVI